MPQFTQWNVPSPFPNVLYNPAAVDKSIAELGNLDIERQKFGLEREKFDRQGTEGDALLAPYLTGAGGGAGTGTAPAGGGGSSGLAPPDINTPAGQVAQRTAAFWSSQGYTPHQVAGIMAGGPAAESGFDPGAVGDSGASHALYQHQGPRWAEMVRRYGPNPTEAQQHEFAAWEISPQGTHAHVGAALRQAKTPEEAAAIWTRDFERPKDTAGEVARRSSVAGRYLNYGNAGPRASLAATAPPEYNPAAGPRVGSVQPAAPGIVPPTPVGTNPNAQVQIPPATTAQIPPPVRAAAQALLAMPEPEAAVAYGPIVRELQAQGLAQNAPPEYPGHEAVAALVGGGEPAAPDVAPSRQAMRLGGTAGAGAAAGTLPPIEQPNQMYQTGIPGITLNLPASGPLAPPPVVTAAAPTAAPSGAATRPPPLQPPPAPTRVIPREEVLPHGLTASQVELARRMVRSGAPVASVAVHIEEMKRANTAARQQDAQQAALDANTRFEREKYLQQQREKEEETQYTRGRQTEADRRQAEVDRRAREKEAREAIEAAKPFQGTADKAQDRNILIEGTKSGKVNTTEYKSAYANFSEPRIGEGGTVVHPEMGPYRLPEDDDGVPITTYGKAHIAIGPGDLGKLRAFETAATPLKFALDEFVKARKDASVAEIAATVAGASTNLKNAWTNAALLAKGPGLYELGALSGPDKELMQGVLSDPSTILGAAVSHETVEKQVKRIKKILDVRLDQATQSYGTGLRIGGAAAPASPAPAPPAVGSVQSGYRFKGGNPGNPNSWEPVK